ncbi:chemotaxis response regulator protein-glutamate methylesterase [uncultured Aureimonas sp.]|uniref:protein-glutamate methylesterase/protein-glutamine glutaminase n=1 Tax=uncultured Aureimonas sp. TaxID=1604662 RepID=UPI0025DE59B6|nr:chemotaxis response regulator protein-glutamate methylesterase [uncultured Aureimonas sp.]
MSPTRVLVVDDSATMRALIRHSLAADPQIEIVGEAADPMQARQAIKALDPDVVTLDIEMPGMNGLDFLDKIMRLRPTPVIMVSTLTQPGQAATIEALRLGAFECVAKPSGMGGRDTLAQLPALVHEAKRAKTQIAGSRDRQISAPHTAHHDWPDLIGIGSSTGGVEVLIALLAQFPADTPPVLIVQHLPATFTASFAARLDRASPAHVVEARSGEPILPGHVYLAPGGRHLSVRRSGAKLITALGDEDPVQGHRPSVDVLFHSIAKVCEGRVTGAILTGMGRDGADGLLAMRRKGFRTLAQDEATSLVYGMPRVAWEIGAAEKRVPIGGMAKAIFH